MYKLRKITFGCALSGVIVLMPFLSSCGSTNLEKIKAKALPAVQSYEHIQNQKYRINQNTRILISSEMYEGDNNIRDLIYNIASEYYTKLLSTKYAIPNIPDIVVYSPNYVFNPGDIVLKYVTSIPQYE
jgi:hypothetical protein